MVSSILSEKKRNKTKENEQIDKQKNKTEAKTNFNSLLSFAFIRFHDFTYVASTKYVLNQLLGSNSNNLKDEALAFQSLKIILSETD